MSDDFPFTYARVSARLLEDGWKVLEEHSTPDFAFFTSPDGSLDVRVPFMRKMRDYERRMLYALTDIALASGDPLWKVILDVAGRDEAGCPVSRANQIEFKVLPESKAKLAAMYAGLALKPAPGVKGS